MKLLNKSLFFFITFLILVPSSVVFAAESPSNKGNSTKPKIMVEDGMTQPVFSKEEAIVETIYVETSVDSDGDGQNDRVHADVIRPKETEEGLKVPVIYEMSPYRAGLNPLDMHDVDVELLGGKPLAADLPGYYDDYFVPRGYAVVLAESIGSGLSNGCPTTGDEQEILATGAVIDWLNGRTKAFTEDGQEVTADWSTGNVGMTGVSYNGTLPNGLATTGIDGLKTIVPIAAISNWYDYYRSNGAVVAPGGYQGEDADILARAVLTRNNPEVCMDAMDKMEKEQDRISGDYNNFWDARNYLNDVHNIHASVFVVHGLNDWNVKTQQFSQLWEQLNANNIPRKLWLHQGGHSSPYYFRNKEWLTTLNKWFDYWLYDMDNGIMEEPTVDIQREDGKWEQDDRWPHSDAVDIDLNLGSNTDGAGSLSYIETNNNTKESLIDDASITANALIQDPLLESSNRQVYLSPELMHSYRMSGTTNVSIRASIDRPAANLTALLVDYGPDRAEIVTRGWMDPRNINDVSESEELIPNKQYTFKWNMQPDDYAFKKGHRIGIVIMSSDHEYTIRPKAGTTITVYPEESYVTLPMVGYLESIRATELKALVERFEENGAFANDRAVRAIKTHVSAVDLFEKQEQNEKVVKHMEGFNVLVDYQLDNELISAKAANDLTDYSNHLIKKWQ